MESKKELADQVQRSKIFAKIAFSLGALEGISYLLKNEDPLSMDQNREHLKNTVNRVLNDLRKSDD